MHLIRFDQTKNTEQVKQNLNTIAFKGVWGSVEK